MPAKTRSTKSTRTAKAATRPTGGGRAAAPGKKRVGAASSRRATGGADLVDVSRTLQQAAQTLQEVAESLAATQTSFGNALFHMPRPSEFEPLAEPLREFARVAPVLSRELGATARSIAELQTVTSRLEGLLERLPQAGGARALSGNATLGSAPTLGLAPRIDAARRAVSDALASLPNETDYVPVARQLRELASVSPSLLAWLEEIPKLSAPLSASVANLRAAERLLFETHDELIEAPPAPAERAAG